MSAASEVAFGCLAITVGWGVSRAIEAWWKQRTPGGRDWGFEMQTAAEKHLETCNDAMWLEDHLGGHGDVGTPAAAPYCGCDTCVVREVLVAAWPIMQEMVLAVSHHSDIEFRLTAGPHGYE